MKIKFCCPYCGREIKHDVGNTVSGIVTLHCPNKECYATIVIEYLLGKNGSNFIREITSYK